MSTEPNVSDMPQDFWAWLDTMELKPLGICESYDEAFEKAPGNTHWVFTRQGLQEMREHINKELT